MKDCRAVYLLKNLLLKLLKSSSVSLEVHVPLVLWKDF